MVYNLQQAEMGRISGGYETYCVCDYGAANAMWVHKSNENCMEICCGNKEKKHRSWTTFHVTSNDGLWTSVDSGLCPGSLDSNEISAVFSSIMTGIIKGKMNPFK